MKVVIMAAGKSTRTYPLTLTRPKPLLKVANKTILAHQLDALRDIVDGAVLVVGYMREQIEAYFGDAYDGMPLEYVEQKEQLGTGHAVHVCADAIDGPFMAVNGDDLFDPDDLRRLAAEEQAALVKHVPDPRLYGIYEVTDGNRAVRLVEKPQEVFSNLANVGAYKFTPHAVVLAWMQDCLELWEEAGWGWALWEFRGGFGPLDSGRNDVAYEDFRGHKLDRKMLDLLRQH